MTELSKITACRININQPVLILIFMFSALLISCGNQPDTPKQAEPVETIDTTEILEQGKAISKAAFKTLSSNLKMAMEEGGVDNALKFCNIQAMPLTDSVSSKYDVNLRRASHRPRNPGNRADSLELEIIKEYLSQIEDNGELKPVVKQHGNKVSYHAPIRITNQLCLSCHGQPGKDIAEADLETLQELYPQDEATGFEMGELRGIWSIYFNRSE